MILIYFYSFVLGNVNKVQKDISNIIISTNIFINIISIFLKS